MHLWLLQDPFLELLRPTPDRRREHSGTVSSGSISNRQIELSYMERNVNIVNFHRLGRLPCSFSIRPRLRLLLPSSPPARRSSGLSGASHELEAARHLRLHPARLHPAGRLQSLRSPGYHRSAQDHAALSAAPMVETDRCGRAAAALLEVR